MGWNDRGRIIVHIFKIVLLILLITGLHAKGAKWQKLKSLEAYSASAYTLKEGVEYLEIRSYYSGSEDKGYNIKKYETLVSLERTPLKSFSPKMLQKFKALSPNLSKQTNMKKSSFCLMSGCISRISNGFMIDSHGKMWRMNTVNDVIGMLGEIDTPAEAKLVLWLNDKNRGTSDENHKDKYRKTSKEYTVISEYDNSIDNFGECGHFTYRININQKGKITEKKLLKKKPSKNGCMTMD